MSAAEYADARERELHDADRAWLAEKIAEAAMYAQHISTAPKDGTLILGMDHHGWREMWWVTNGTDYANYWQDHSDSEPDPQYWCPLPIIEKK